MLLWCFHHNSILLCFLAGVFGLQRAMAQPLVVACIFCFFCCAHVHCTSHNDNTAFVSGNHSPWTASEADFIHTVFKRYGDGKTMSLKGFEDLLKEINLEKFISSHQGHHLETVSDITGPINSTHKDQKKRSCMSSAALLNGSDVLTHEGYRDVCPVLLSQLVPSIDLNIKFCREFEPHHHPDYDGKTVWLYSTLSIVGISLCGLLGVAVIPVMQKVFYQQLIQFLVALAVGTLCGDALLHLLPHAMMASHNHSHGQSQDSEELDHNANIWLGLVAMMGIVFFYFTEKCLTMVSEWWKRRQRKTKQHVPRVQVMRDDDSDSKRGQVGEKLCKHKYSSYPYCYGEITDNQDGHQLPDPNASPEANTSTSKNSSPRLPNGCGDVAMSDGPLSTSTPRERDTEPSTQSSLLGDNDISPAEKERYKIIIREHNNSHHGHSHTHGHVHSAPQSMSSVAWMVIMGDGLHNFTDGMAIGAAFATNIAGGFSTSLAVFCHELPHELGDFAVLLKAGMSAKEAVFYNMLSSVLCFFGMCFGIFLGHDEHMYQWVFAAAAGMFLYIALVDMIPELTTSHSNEGGSLFQCLLHFAGLMLGIGIMLLIAIYEHDLQTAFDD